MNTHNGEKPHQCNQCEYSSSRVERSQTNATNVTTPHFTQAIWTSINGSIVRKDPTNASIVIWDSSFQVIWGCIWKPTVVICLSNATYATSNLPKKDMQEHTAERSRTNATVVTFHSLRRAIWKDTPRHTARWWGQPNVTNETSGTANRLIHSGEKLNKCDHCNYSSSRADHLRMHMKIHSGERLNACSQQCEFSSSRADKLTRHLRTHNKVMNQCDFKSHEPSNLKAHLMIHSGKKPHKCNDCDYSSSIAVHLRRHTSSQHNTQMKKKRKKKKGKAWVLCVFACAFKYYWLG